MTPEQVNLFAGIDVKCSDSDHSFVSCDQKEFRYILREIGNNDPDQVAKIAAELMEVCKKATKQDSSFYGRLRVENAKNFRTLNFHIDSPDACLKNVHQPMNESNERSLVDIQGKGTVIARPTLPEYKQFLSQYCSDTYRFVHSRHHFEKTEQLQPGQSIRFSKAHCIHAGPQDFKEGESRILMIIDHTPTQADQVHHDA